MSPPSKRANSTGGGPPRATRTTSSPTESVQLDGTWFGFPSHEASRARSPGEYKKRTRGDLGLAVPFRPMKRSSDAILRTEQADYLDALHVNSARALATMARTAPLNGRDPLLARMEARAAERGYPISDPEVACFLAIVARLARPRLVVELGTNIGYGAIVMARAAGEGARVVTIEYSQDLVGEARGFIAEAGLSQRIEVRHGRALAELAKVEGPIDLLYVDCVKEEYLEYLEIAAPKLGAARRHRRRQRPVGRARGAPVTAGEPAGACRGAGRVQPGPRLAAGPLRGGAAPGRRGCLRGEDSDRYCMAALTGSPPTAGTTVSPGSVTARL